MKRFISALLMALVLLSVSVAASAGPVKSDYNWQGTGWLMFYDASTYETLFGSAPVSFYDEFIGADTAFPAAGSDESGMPWVVKDTGDATEAVVADTANGVAQLALAATSEKEEAGVYMDDNRQLDLDKGFVWEARVKLSVLPTLVAEMQWGVAGDYVETGDAVAYSILFDADGSGAVNVIYDDGTTDSTFSTGVTVLATDWKIYRIDASDQDAIKFYIDGVQVGSSLDYAGTGANAILQPYFYVYKASGVGVGTMQVDYVRVWSNR